MTRHSGQETSGTSSVHGGEEVRRNKITVIMQTAIANEKLAKKSRTDSEKNKVNEKSRLPAMPMMEPKAMSAANSRPSLIPAKIQVIANLIGRAAITPPRTGLDM